MALVPPDEAAARPDEAAASSGEPAAPAAVAARQSWPASFRRPAVPMPDTTAAASPVQTAAGAQRARMRPGVPPVARPARAVAGPDAAVGVAERSAAPDRVPRCADGCLAARIDQAAPAWRRWAVPRSMPPGPRGSMPPLEALRPRVPRLAPLAARRLARVPESPRGRARRPEPLVSALTLRQPRAPRKRAPELRARARRVQARPARRADGQS